MNYPEFYEEGFKRRGHRERHTEGHRAWQNIKNRSFLMAERTEYGKSECFYNSSQLVRIRVNSIREN